MSVLTGINTQHLHEIAAVSFSRTDAFPTALAPSISFDSGQSRQ